MTFQRDLTWETLDHLYRSSVAHQFARYALGLSYEMLPDEVVHQAKRCLLDALGCAIGAYEAPGRPVCEAVVKELGGVQEATVFGSGLRTSAPNATLVNSFLVRFLDYNDLGGGGHNTPPALGRLMGLGEEQIANAIGICTSHCLPLGILDADREEMTMMKNLRFGRSEERRVGKECRSRWSAY